METVAYPYQGVEVGRLLDGCVSQLQEEFGRLIKALPLEADQTRKQVLIEFLHRSKQRLLRLHTLIEWSNHSKSIATARSFNAIGICHDHLQHVTGAADELYRTNAELPRQHAPPFPVETALEVLATGTYCLPSSISSLRPEPPPPTGRQRALVRHMDQLITSQLLKADLPAGVGVVQVANGAVVLRTRGLYEARLSLVQVPLPPAEQQPQDQPPAQQQQQQQPPEKEQLRWQWALLDLVLLPAAAKGPVLQQVQLDKLLLDLNHRMRAAADAAVIKAQQGAAEQQAAGGPAPSAADTAGTGAGMLRDLHLHEHAADEVTLPLRVLHGVLRDISARLLLDAAHAAALALAQPSSRWEGHIKLEDARVLQPGFRIAYWTNTAVLPLSDIPGASDQLVALEVGLSRQGLPQVLHAPQLQVLDAREPLQLQLDHHHMDVEALLLRAAAVQSHNQLARVMCDVNRGLAKQGLAGCCHLRWMAGPLQQEAGAAPGAGPAVELVVDGAVHLRLSHQLWSGRLQLRPGPGHGSELQLDRGGAGRAAETTLYPAQRAAARRGAEAAAGTGAASVAQQQLLQLVEGVANIARQAFAHKRKLGLIKVVRALGLSYHVPSEQLLRAYAVANPMPGRSRYYNQWTLFWPLAGPPAAALHAPMGARGGQVAAAASSRNGTLPGSTLSFMLAADVFAQPRLRYSLLVFHCNRQGAQQLLLRWIPVPAAASLQARPAARAAAAATGKLAAAPAAAATAAEKRQRDSESPGPRSKLQRTSSAGGQDGGGPIAEPPENHHQQQQQQQQPARQLEAPAQASTSPTPAALRSEGVAIPAAALRSELAIHDGPAELEAVIAWCRRRMAYERLLHELLLLRVPLQERLQLPPATPQQGAGGAAQQQGELNTGHAATDGAAAAAGMSNGPSRDAHTCSGALEPLAAASAGVAEAAVDLHHRRHIRLLGLPGMQLPQQLPSCAAGTGLQQVTLHVGRGGAFWAEVRGRLFSSSSTTTTTTTTTTGTSTTNISLSAALGLLSPACVGQVPGGLVLRYRLEEGQSSIHLLQDLMQLARAQQLLARLQALALGTQQLRLLPQPLQQPQPCAAAAAAAAAPAIKEQQQQQQQQLANGNLRTNVAAAVKPERLPAAAAPALEGQLVWRWPLTGAVVLKQYSLTAAVLHCYAAQPDRVAALAAAELQPPQGIPPLTMQLSWDVQMPTFAAGMLQAARRKAAAAAAAATGATAAAAAPWPAVPAQAAPSPAAPPPAALATPAGSPGPPQLQQQAAPGPGAAAGPIVRCRVACEPPLPEAITAELQLMAQLQEEGVLLDTLAVAAVPLAALARATAPSALLQHQLLPCHVSITCVDGPWHVQLALAPPGAPLAHLLGLRPAAGGNTLLTLAIPKHGHAAAPAGQQQQDAKAAASHSLKQFAEQQETAAGLELVHGRAGLVTAVWVPNQQLEGVLSGLIRFLACGG